MKMFVKSKVIGAMMLCLVMAITLCACKGPASSPSDPNSTSQMSSTTSTDKHTESATESSTTTTTTTTTTKKATKKTTKKTTKPTTTTTTTTTTQPQKTTAQKVIGKWRGNVDVRELLLGEGYPVEDTMMVACDIEFTTGGILYETIDRESLKTAYTGLVTDLMEDSLEQESLTKEDFEAAWGMPYDEYITEMVEMAMEMVPHTSISAYKFEGEDLYVLRQGEEYYEWVEYFFNGEDELTLVELEGPIMTYTRIG